MIDAAAEYEYFSADITRTFPVNGKFTAQQRAVYEIVMDGLTESAVARAMQVGLDQLQDSPGILRITAGNYGGKLGPHHFHLRRLAEVGAGR